MPWNQVSIVEQRLGFLIEASKRIEMSNQNRVRLAIFCDSRLFVGPTGRQTTKHSFSHPWQSSFLSKPDYQCVDGGAERD